MHEFSLAQSIIEIVDESLKKNGAEKAVELHLEIGTLSGVEIPALEMALESLKTNSVIETTEIKLFITKAKAICGNCNKEFYPEDLFTPCPECSSYNSEIMSGKELLVKSIVAE